MVFLPLRMFSRKCPTPAAFAVPLGVIEPNKYDRSYNVMCCSFQNWYLLEKKTISSHDHKTESCTSNMFFLKFPTNILVHFMWKFSSGVLHQDGACQSASYHCLNSPLHYVRLPRLITTACLQGGKRHDRETPSRDQCAD